MAPRRLILVDFSAHQRSVMLDLLKQHFSAVPAITLAVPVAQQLRDVLENATRFGAQVIGEVCDRTLRPLLVLGGRPEMELAQTDLFAPVLTVFDAVSLDAAVSIESASSFSLTTCIFGDDEVQARQLASRLFAPTVLINDLIVPTADPRVPFGGRRASGFGVTRGGDGLLEMTFVKVIAVRRNRESRQYDATDERHCFFFAGISAVLHGGSLPVRWSGMRRVLAAALSLRRK